jgi:hypothetical protein
MKVVDHSKLTTAGQSPGVLTRALKTLSSTLLDKDSEAQDAVINALDKVLDNRFVMLRNITLEGTEIAVPLILIGPPGIRVIYASSSKGVFRAKENSWEQLDDRSQRFQMARPNLLERASLLSRAVDTYLASNGYHVPASEPVLFFSNPGVHVDSTRPNVRIVLTDALDRYIATYAQSVAFMEQEQVLEIAKAFVGDVFSGSGTQLVPEHDAFSFQELPEEKPVRPSPLVLVDRSEPQALKKIPFSSRQWIFLGLLSLLNIIILTVFVAMVIMTP